MKIYLSLFIFALISCQQNPALDDKEKVKAVLLDYYDALKMQDFNKMRALTTSDFILFEGGDILNNDSVVSFFKNFPKFTVQYKFDGLDIKIDKESGRAHYYKEASFVLNDTMHLVVDNLESAVFRKENNNWKLELLHTSKRK